MSEKISTLIERMATDVKYNPVNILKFQTIYELALLLISFL